MACMMKKWRKFKMNDKYDFSGWATRNNIKCSDGRTILKDAFVKNNGTVVPLVWNHQHNEVENVLGHALLENRDEGVYAYCSFNDSERAQISKMQVQHGDITALSIYANQLQQQGPNVVHGMIREVSLVLAGANKGAYIDNVIQHGEMSDSEAEIFVTVEGLEMFHAEENHDKEEKNMDEKGQEKEKTVQEVIDSMTDEQKNVMYALVGQALEENGIEDDDEGDEEMKHNLFESDKYDEGNYLSHSDQSEVLELAKSSSVGTFQNALRIYADENNLQHDAISSGFVQTGDGNVGELFPEYKDMKPGAPELLTNDQGWISSFMNGTHKSPISRLRVKFVDIRNLKDLRAKGYKKGKQKIQTGNFNLIHRTVDPQTVYVKSALHRDDVVDITDFDYVEYLYGIDKMQLNEEIATAALLGDGRETGDADKIQETHIVPIWTDDDLFSIHVDVDLAAAKKELQGTNTGANFGDNYIYAESVITALLYARENFKGSGTPTLYCAPRTLNTMLLARDLNGRRIYNTKTELATALNVSDIVTVEQFTGKVRTDKNNKKHNLLGIVVNPNDYTFGSTKGGQLSHFTDFDIDFNQLKSLLETRLSGMLTKVYSAIVLEEPVATESGGTAGTGEDDGKQQ